MAELTPRQTLIVNGVQNITRLLTIGWLGAVAILITKLLDHGQSISEGNIDIPIRYAWTLLVALTAGHVAMSSFLVRNLAGFRRSMPSPEARDQVFEVIRSDRNLLVHGLIPRTTLWRPGGHWYRMDPRDPSAWAAYLGQIILFAAVLPWSLSASGHLSWAPAPLSWLGVIIAFVITSANWYAGSAWVISLSRLASDRIYTMEGWGQDPVFTFLTNNDEVKFSLLGTILFSIIRIFWFAIAIPIVIFNILTGRQSIS
jgi:hypothetical protein